MFPQLPVDGGQGAFYGVLVPVAHLIVGDGIDIYDHICLEMAGEPHGGAFGFDEDLTLVLFLRKDNRLSVFEPLKRPALQKIDHVFVVL